MSSKVTNIGQEEDIISSLHLTDDNVLTVTTWDGTISVYDIKPQDNAKETSRLGSSLLVRKSHDSTVLSNYNNSKATSQQWFFGDVDGRLYLSDIFQGGDEDLGLQELRLPSKDESKLDSQFGISTSGICKIKGLSDHRTLISASWNGDLNFVDTRLMSTVKHTNIDRKIYTMDFEENSTRICSVTNGNMVDIRDIRRLEVPYQLRESGLRDQVRDLKIMNNGDGYAQSSIGGRISMDFFEDTMQDKKYGFRCHRRSLKDIDYVYPVNSIAFKPQSNLFFSGGSDGKVSIWDYQLKKRVKTLDFFNKQSVVKLDCNKNVLVVGCSNDDFKTEPILDNHGLDELPTRTASEVCSNIYFYEL